MDSKILDFLKNEWVDTFSIVLSDDKEIPDKIEKLALLGYKCNGRSCDDRGYILFFKRLNK
jgi:hypothetical protein